MHPTRNPVGWFEIYVQDMPRAKAFYEATFAVTLDPLPNPSVSEIVQMLAFPMQPDLPGCGGALVKYEGKDSGGGGALIYFTCEDCAVEAAKAARAGGSIFKPKFSIGPYGFISLIFDTEENMIGLHSLR